MKKLLAWLVLFCYFIDANAMEQAVENAGSDLETLQASYEQKTDELKSSAYREKDEIDSQDEQDSDSAIHEEPSTVIEVKRARIKAPVILLGLTTGFLCLYYVAKRKKEQDDLLVRFQRDTIKGKLPTPVRKALEFYYASLNEEDHDTYFLGSSPKFFQKYDVLEKVKILDSILALPKTKILKPENNDIFQHAKRILKLYKQVLEAEIQSRKETQTRIKRALQEADTHLPEWPTAPASGTYLYYEESAHSEAEL